jgi:hypothetical protein
MKKKKSILTLCLLFYFNLFAGNKVEIKVFSGKFDRKDCVVSADISDYKVDKSSGIKLYEKVGNKKVDTPCQLLITEDGKAILNWILSGNTPSEATRTFIAEKQKKNKSGNTMIAEDTGKSLVLKKGDKGVLEYNYVTVYPPEGIDESYKRSGFIHPAYSPSGNVLTTIQPKDHYHHYGIWNPWTKIEYDGRMYDLWNLKDKKGTVRAKDIKSVIQGDVVSGFRAGLDHYIFTPGAETVIMNEVWDIKSWNIPEGFLWDFKSELSPSASSPVLIKEYRYAGFGWRATEEWTKENCEMFTSEGKTRQEIDGTNARWIYVTGQCEKGKSGLLIMGHPGNYNFPEPLRIWDEKANGGRGDAFVNFAPTKDRDWELKPDQQYELRYRVLSYDGSIDKQTADRLWNDFAYPPQTKVELLTR